MSGCRKFGGGGGGRASVSALGSLAATLAIVGAGLVGATSSAHASAPAEIGVSLGAPNVVTRSSLRPESADVLAGGLEAVWQWEYALAKSAFESGKRGGTLVPGCSGTISQQEAERQANDSVQCSPSAAATGLAPETVYYLRFGVKNALGPEALQVVAAKTFPLFPRNGNVQVQSVAGETAKLKGDVIPAGAETHWHLEYSASKQALEEGRGIAGPEHTIAAIEPGESPVVGEDEITGLAPDTTYYVRVVSSNAHGEGRRCELHGEEPEGNFISTYSCVAPAIFQFGTGGPPLAATFGAHSVDAVNESLRVLGSVEPHGFDTHYYAEYVSQAQFEAGGWSEASRTPSEDAGPGPVIQEGGEFPTDLVGVDVPGLTAGTTYHYRLVATSVAPGNPTVAGGEQELTVPGPALAGEPSCANQSLRLGLSAQLPDCRAYEQVTPPDKAGAQDLFKYGATLEGSAVGEDGEHVFLHAPGVEWGPSPDARIASYLFSRTASGWQLQSSRPASYTGPNSLQPVLFSPDLAETALEAEWEVSPATHSSEIEFGAGPFAGPYATLASIPRAQVDRGETWAAASADFSTLVLQSKDHALLETPTGTLHGDDLYEWSAGTLRLVNGGIGTCGASLVDGFEGYEGHPLNAHVSAHAVSADGSRVFFQATHGGNCENSPHLFMRVQGTRTVDIGQYLFVGANAQGSELVLERDEGTRHEIALYDTEAEEVTRSFPIPQAIAAAPSNDTRTPVVSEQLTSLYFFAASKLTADAPVLQRSGDQDLYRLDLSDGQLRFVAQSGPSSGAFFTGHSASPDGRYFYWIAAEVPGVPGSSNGTDQAYRYDSATRLLQCVSCASSSDPHPALRALFLEPGATHPDDATPTLRDASANGDYVFFDTPAALVPQDADGEVKPLETLGEHPSVAYSVSSDVYEWRNDGVDGCAHTQGCLALISSGTGGYKNEFLGTTASGRDVFFATHAALTGSDRDTAGDIYDARIGGGFPPAAQAPAECEGCQTPQAAPIDATPASQSFLGPTLTPPTPLPPVSPAKPKPRPCRKGMVRRHGKCVKVHASKRARHAKHAHNRGARR
jgi:hypothetical protein